MSKMLALNYWEAVFTVLKLKAVTNLKRQVKTRMSPEMTLSSDPNFNSYQKNCCL